LDIDQRIHNVGLSLTDSGIAIFNYRGGPYSEQGYGAVASVPRNVSAVFPAFWGGKVDMLKSSDSFKNAENYFRASMNFFMEIIKSNQRVVCVPYMSLKIDIGGIQYEDEMHAFLDKWMERGLKDKYYNPNLTDKYEDFGVKL
jgi:hypothetical protein